MGPLQLVPVDIWVVECDGAIHVFDTMDERIHIGGGQGYFWNMCGFSKKKFL